jgi:Ca2+-binding RTX toxin-like protein
LATDAATTLSFAGSANQTVTLDATTLSVSKFDGSTATGNITLTTTDQTAIAATTDVTVSGGAGNDSLTVSAESNDMSITGGAGNDTIVDTAVDTADTIDGGDGTDTLSTVMAQANTLDAATPTTYTITNVENLTITDEFDGTLALANIATSLTTVNLTRATAAADDLMAGGDFITGPASALTVNLGGTFAGNDTDMGGDLTVTDTGTGTTDALTLANKAINSTAGANIDVFNANNVTSTGYEAVTINTGASGGAGVEQEIATLTITPDSVSAGVSLTLTGTNAIDITTSLTTTSTGLLTVDAAGLTAQAAGVTTLDINATSQGTGGTASITGSAGYDLIDVGNFASTIVAGAGNDSIAGGTAADNISGDAGNDSIAGAGGNDRLFGGDGNDVITDSIGGSVSIDGGAGNDTIVTTNTLLTSGDTLVGGDGTDILSTDSGITTGTTAARVSGFEILTFSATGQSQSMANFVNNTFTQINTMGAALTVTNAGSAIATLGMDVPGGTTAFSRLVDSSADVLAVVALTDAVDGDNATVLTVDNEETLTFNTADGDLQLRTLNAADATSITITGDNLFAIETAIVGSTSLATINASGVTGTETIEINASASTTALTFTGGTTTGTTTLTTGSGADIVTAGAVTAVLNATTGTGNDSITGNAGADIIDAGSGADTIIGGEGIDSITGGSGSDIITLTETTAVSDEIVISATGTDSVTGFAAGTGGDQFDFSVAGLETAFNVSLDLLVDGTTAIAAGTAMAVQEVTTDVAAGAGSTLFVLRGVTFDTTADVENAIETGDFEISVHADVAAGDGFLVAYSDGTDTYVAIARVDVDGGADIDAGDLTVTNLVKLVGNPSIAASEFINANFDFIA